MVFYSVEMPKSRLLLYANFLISRRIVPAQLSSEGGVLHSEIAAGQVSLEQADLCSLLTR